MRDLRVAIVADFLEERWFAMDLVAEMLQLNLARAGIEVSLLRPSFGRPASAIGPGKVSANADRLFNRLIGYPLWLRRHRDAFDLFHIVDHSYSHLAHYLQRHRTVVTCHDLDTFRCVLEPAGEPRSAAFRLMTRHILAGFRNAAWITTPSRAVRSQIAAHGLCDPARVTVIPNGVHPAFASAAEPAADANAERLLGCADRSAPELLHVGTTNARKRIDVLLCVFAEVRRAVPHARLIQVGGDFDPRQAELASRLGLAGAIAIAPHLDWATLGAVYRRAAVAMLPSEAEGFGLPLVEAMACGTPVIASDLPVLRELGGDAAVYCPVADVPAWTRQVMTLLIERRDHPDRWQRRRRECVEGARAFSWNAYAAKTAEIYRIVNNTAAARETRTQAQAAVN